MDDARRLVASVAPGSAVTDLGGCLSLNLHLHATGQVLRVQHPSVSRRRVEAIQDLRRTLLSLGLLVAEPHALVRCGSRWAELESFVPHEKPPPTWDSYLWMYEAMGKLHAAMASVEVALPRPSISTYGPPSSLRRWLSVTTRVARPDPVLESTGALVRKLQRRWIPATKLPTQPIHGDVRLGNVGWTQDREPVYLDFGFAAVNRPRIHDLAYSLAWIVLRPDDSGRPETFDWSTVDALFDAYQRGGGTPLTAIEREAFWTYLAAVPLYHVTVAGFHDDPDAAVRNATRPFLRISEYLLDEVDVPGR